MLQAQREPRSLATSTKNTTSARSAPWAWIALSAALIACGPVKRPDGGEGLLPVGSAAPDFVGKASDQGAAVRLSGVRGRPAVVYFYPKDGTPGCTKEACAFRDAWKKYEQEDVAVFGISDDSGHSHDEFQKKHKIPFPLVSDESGEIGRAYGVKRGIIGYDRVSFLIDREGKVAYVWPSVDPGVHADEVLAKARTLPSGVAP